MQSLNRSANTAERGDRGISGSGGVIDALFDSEASFDIEPFLGLKENLVLGFFFFAVTSISFFSSSSLFLLQIDDKS
jgi:hypothetical protein